MTQVELNANEQSLVPGRLLRTRNGASHTGNAIVLGPGREWGLYRIKTDFGNVIEAINTDEIRSLFTLGDVTDLKQWQADRVELMMKGFEDGEGLNEHRMNPTGRGFRIPMPRSRIYFYPEDPRPEEFFIKDIAHKLAMQCRYGGGTADFYSVAEHSCHLHDYFRTRRLRKAALMHDRAEAYLQDFLRPLKKKCQPWYGDMESNIERVSAPVFKLDFPNPPDVMEADYRICIDEKMQAYTCGYTSENGFEDDPTKALGIKLQYWSPQRAYNEFMKRWETNDYGLD